MTIICYIIIYYLLYCIRWNWFSLERFVFRTFNTRTNCYRDERYFTSKYCHWRYQRNIIKSSRPCPYFSTTRSHDTIIYNTYIIILLYSWIIFYTRHIKAHPCMTYNIYCFARGLTFAPTEDKRTNMMILYYIPIQL